MTAHRRPRSILAGLVLAVVAWVAPGAVAVASPETGVVSVYIYGAPVYHAPEHITAPERGSTLRGYAFSTDAPAVRAVDAPSHGNVMRPDGSVAGPTTNYSSTTGLVQIAGGTATTPVPSQRNGTGATALDEPQRYNRDKGGLESMELSHEPIPYRDGGKNVIPRWPQDHANVDPFRFPGY